MLPLWRWATRVCGLLAPSVVAVREVDFSLLKLRMEQTAKLPGGYSAKDVNFPRLFSQRSACRSRKTKNRARLYVERGRGGPLQLFLDTSVR